ncbi:MAG: hypothetical protein ACYDHG_13760 [Desulfomonilaceae bacterium]
MIRRLFFAMSIYGCLLIFFDLTAFAQWPLGKDLSPATAKSVENSGYLTGSGRFQVFVSPNIKGHTFMLDTETGRIWIFKKDNSSGDISLQRIPVDQLHDDQAHGAVHQKN